MTLLDRALLRSRWNGGAGAPTGSGFSLRPEGARRRAVVAVSAVLALVGSGIIAASAATPPPAHLDNTVGLKEVGPIDEANGFPLWYKDTNNVRLELCLDPSDTNCIMGDVPDPTKPVSFPDNFPDEAFWAAAESPIDAGGGETGILVTAVEAAFSNELPAPKTQVSFGRIRVRVAGVIDGATYKVTHPFGIDTIVAESGAVKGLNVTEDIGSLTWDGVFDRTLGARTGPFLKWDPSIGPAAPAGYLGDVSVAHEVVGSPYGADQNVFRVEGPAGSFTGSAQLCADAGLGDSPTATDDCIENKKFFVQGKIATRAGVQVMQATYRDTGTSGDRYIDLFAKSEPGQRLVVSGTGVSQTVMRASGGKYFARVKVNGAPPSDLAVTNTTDSPDTVDHVDSSLFGDKVHIESAVYDIDNKRLTVKADSGEAAAVLKLGGYPDVVPTVGGSNNARTFVVNDLDVPPAEAVVTSNKGGFDSDDVIVDGNDLPSAQVVADLTATTTDLTVGQSITLDGTATQGTVDSVTFSATLDGDPVSGVLATTGNALTRTFTAPSGGDGVYVVTMTVVGPGNNNTSTTSITLHVEGASTPPVANAGIDQIGIVPTSVVTLNGSASAFANTYAWTVISGGTLPLVGANTANPTFVMPVTTTASTWTVQLTVTNAQNVSATDTVVVSNDPDVLSIDAASYKRGGQEWRVRGGAKHCSANNTVTVTWNRPNAAPVVLGTATPALDLGVCAWDFRLKNASAAQRPTGAGTLKITSALGGQVLAQPFTFL